MICHLTAKPVPYKSPFEKKRELEIKRLDKKVEKVQGEIQTQQKQLQEIKSNNKLQQLTILRKEVR